MNMVSERTNKVIIQFVQKFEQQGHYVRPVVSSQGWRLEIGTLSSTCEVDVNMAHNVLAINYTYFNRCGYITSKQRFIEDLDSINFLWLFDVLTTDLMDV